MSRDPGKDLRYPYQRLAQTLEMEGPWVIIRAPQRRAQRTGTTLPIPTPVMLNVFSPHLDSDKKGGDEEGRSAEYLLESELIGEIVLN